MDRDSKRNRKIEVLGKKEHAQGEGAAREQNVRSAFRPALAKKWPLWA
jgi:hypothetical protein